MALHGAAGLPPRGLLRRHLWGDVQVGDAGLGVRPGVRSVACRGDRWVRGLELLHEKLLLYQMVVMKVCTGCEALPDHPGTYRGEP